MKKNEKIMALAFGGLILFWLVSSFFSQRSSSSRGRSIGGQDIDPEEFLAAGSGEYYVLAKDMFTWQYNVDPFGPFQVKAKEKKNTGVLLNLQGIIFSDKEKAVIVDNEVFYQGDVIGDDYKVTEIGRDYVLFSQRGKEIRADINNEYPAAQAPAPE